MMLDLNEIYLGDCLHVMKEIENGSVDMILTDLPYGVLNKKNKNAKWDVQIPLAPLWNEYKRIIKPNGAIVLFGQGLFSAQLMMSNPKMYRYSLVWRKTNQPTGFLNSKRMPLREHEDILVFYKKLPTYNPQMVKVKSKSRLNHSRGKMENEITNTCYGKVGKPKETITNEKYPRSVIDYPRPFPAVHSAQKPIGLLSWLIKTYTNEGETVLDSCIGSGSTAIACLETKRNFIGIEYDECTFNSAKQRIEAYKSQLRLFEL